MFTRRLENSAVLAEFSGSTAENRSKPAETTPLEPEHGKMHKPCTLSERKCYLCTRGTMPPKWGNVSEQEKTNRNPHPINNSGSARFVMDGKAPVVHPEFF